MGNCNACARPDSKESKPSLKPKKSNRDRKLYPFTGDFVRSPAPIHVLKDVIPMTMGHQTQISDKYILGRELGRGEFGITYLCTDRETHEALACKSISKRKLRTTVEDKIIFYRGGEENPGRR